MARIRGPKLSTGDVRDDGRLADAIYRLLKAQPDRAAASRKVQRAQRRLRKLVDDAAWDAYLSVEEAVNERADAQLHLVARWAFAEGRSGR